MGSGVPHRGSINDIAGFSRKFVAGRMNGFEKDMKICLTAMKSTTRSGYTHAYFPALGACCGTMEYLTALHRGRINGVGWRQIAAWADIYLPQPDYNDTVVRVLIEAFRHPVAHRGIASGVWVDQNPGPTHGRRVTWRILANAARPAVEIVCEDGVLRLDPPWPCPYTHRVHIHLRSMAGDVKNAAKKYLRDVESDNALQHNFAACMRQLYPC